MNFMSLGFFSACSFKPQDSFGITIAILVILNPVILSVGSQLWKLTNLNPIACKASNGGMAVCSE
jgi:hypothetical protein